MASYYELPLQPPPLTLFLFVVPLLALNVVNARLRFLRFSFSINVELVGSNYSNDNTCW